jgi:hypothetical protein
MNWSQDILKNIDHANDLKIAPFRDDGVTAGTPTWIWAVVVDGELYVRAYSGQASRWYKSAVAQGAGKIIAAGMTLDVTFEPADGPINDQIDEAYCAKYTKSPYLGAMIGSRPRAATIRIRPKGE